MVGSCFACSCRMQPEQLGAAGALSLADKNRCRELPGPRPTSTTLRPSTGAIATSLRSILPSSSAVNFCFYPFCVYACMYVCTYIQSTLFGITNYNTTPSRGIPLSGPADLCARSRPVYTGFLLRNFNRPWALAPVFLFGLPYFVRELSASFAAMGFLDLLRLSAWPPLAPLAGW